MVEKKTIIIGVSTVAAVVLIGVCTAIYFRNPPNMVHLKLNGTWFEAFEACRSQKNKRVANINSQTELDNVLIYIKENKLEENETFWLSAVALGPKLSASREFRLERFVDLYTGNATNLVKNITYSLNRDAGNCLATEYTPQSLENTNFKHFNRNCFEKSGSYVLCVDF